MIEIIVDPRVHTTQHTHAVSSRLKEVFAAVYPLTTTLSYFKVYVVHQVTPLDDEQRSLLTTMHSEGQVLAWSNGIESSTSFQSASTQEEGDGGESSKKVTSVASKK